MATETLRPDGAGADTDIASQYPDSTYHWDKVDEADADEDTYVYTNSLYDYQRDLYNLPASSGSGTINKITVYFRGKGVTGISNIKPSIKSDSTVTDGEIKTFTSSSIWETFSQEWATNPADDEAWEWADIDALQIGISATTYNSTYYTYCTQVYVVVDYTVTPTVTTQAVTEILETTATGNGNITSIGGASVTQHGHCWAETTNPDTDDSKTSKGAGSTGAFTSDIINLSAGTLYYVRAYATNSYGTAYGDNVTFTSDTTPTITTQVVKDITGTTATGQGNVTDLGGANLTQHGHCWNTSTNPTTSNDKTTLGAKDATGAFESSITGLTPATGYYVRAYGTNAVGTSYGDNVYFIASIDVAGYIWMEGSNLHGFDENAVERIYVYDAEALMFALCA